VQEILSSIIRGVRGQLPKVAGNLVVSNSLKLRGKKAFSKVMPTVGLEKNPMTLAVSDLIL
jgi:hypothetical protein